jgi:acetylornithine deacetylase/succinyl-diaminopimelate desuccinylase-like protein
VRELDESWLEELFGWLRIPSVSADPAHAADVRAAGQWLCDFVERAGGSCELVETGGPAPLAVGELAASRAVAGAPTVLLYGHFDVQPPGDDALWESPPFEPEVRDGWIYGRGSVDDKGNFYLLLKAVETLAAEGELPVDIRIASDGEEETGGHSIVEFLEADERGADACLVFDSVMPRQGWPAFDIGTRGILYYHLTLRSGERDLHSGLFGGAALNAVHALTRVLAAVVPTPEALRAGAAEPTTEELAAWKELEPGAAVLAREGARPLDARAADDLYLRTFASAAVDVNGIRGGEADLQKTVLPVEARANVSVRLAPGQDTTAIAEVFERLVRGAVPEGADLEVELRAASPPGLIPPDAPAIKLALEAFERVVGRRPLLVRTGGTLPIIPALAAKGIPTVLSGFAVPGHNVHSPNERFPLANLPLGVAAARETLRAFAALS